MSLINMYIEYHLGFWLGVPCWVILEVGVRVVGQYLGRVGQEHSCWVEGHQSSLGFWVIWETSNKRRAFERCVVKQVYKMYGTFPFLLLLFLLIFKFDANNNITVS